MPEIYLQAPEIYFQDFQKVVEYIPQLFENNAGVVEYIPQLLYYSITCPPKSWWTSYIKL